MSLINEIIKDALTNKRYKQALLEKAANIALIVEEAQNRWIPYQPQPEECVSVGIDGSFNFRQYQGLNLYAVGAAAVDSKNNLICKRRFSYDTDTLRVDKFGPMMLEFEYEIAKEALTQDNNNNCTNFMVLIDGSLMSWLESGGFSDRNKGAGTAQIRSFLDTIEEAQTRKNHTIAFISKNSDRTKQFEEFTRKSMTTSSVGDILYFNKMREKVPGFSRPYQENSLMDKFGLTIIETYIRLKRDTQVLKLELANLSGAPLSTTQLDRLQEETIPAILDKLVYHSIDGYPYCLRLAHFRCKISNEDIERLSRVYGLKTQLLTSARGVLNED